ncbi:MAG: tetratricopeptide repeat protein [candidate division Zixibacteria bacterium]|nr:tetratricopeptide repeat protein [candidate division Zixibacteria bacterium]
MSRKPSDKNNPEQTRHLVMYYVTIGLFLIGLALPQARTWGFNWWAYQPTVAQAALILIAIAAGPILWWWSRRTEYSQKHEPPESGALSSYWLAATLTLVVSAALYILFPSRTHFLGDGYQLLSHMADQGGNIKSWDIGASFVNNTVFGLLGSPSREAALTAYRIVAVGSGLITLIVIAVASARLFENRLSRFLFLLGVVTGGYALQFFGYVENYALFTAAVISFALLGLLAALGKLSRWWAVLPVVAACLLHIFGLTLLPALVYLLLFDRQPLVGLSQLSKSRKRLLFAIVAAGAVGLYLYLFYNYYFFRFAFLPVVPDRFTVDNDYLLSPKHIGDVLNLVLLLVPGLLIFLARLLSDRKRELFGKPAGRFLLVMTLSTLAAVYLFNPGIGMPRNWDLFSLVGIPLAVLVFYYLLSDPGRPRQVYLATSLAIMLGLLTLAPRVISQHVPETAIAHFDNYVKLDRTRNRNARGLLIDYYEEIGDSLAADREHIQALKGFPDAILTNRGKQLMDAGKIDQAEELFRRALKVNPIFVNAYGNLASCQIIQNRLDSAMALLEIANGLNPYSASTISNIGTVYLRRGEYADARNAFLEALRIDSSSVTDRAGLTSAYVKLHDAEHASESMEVLHRTCNMSRDYYLQASDVCMKAGLISTARTAFRIAVECGASRSEQQALIGKYPELGS